MVRRKNCICYDLALWKGYHMANGPKFIVYRTSHHHSNTPLSSCTMHLWVCIYALAFTGKCVQRNELSLYAQTCLHHLAMHEINIDSNETRTQTNSLHIETFGYMYEYAILSFLSKLCSFAGRFIVRLWQRLIAFMTVMNLMRRFRVLTERFDDELFVCVLCCMHVLSC